MKSPLCILTDIGCFLRVRREPKSAIARLNLSLVSTYVYTCGSVKGPPHRTYATRRKSNAPEGRKIRAMKGRPQRQHRRPEPLSSGPSHQRNLSRGNPGNPPPPTETTKGGAKEPGNAKTTPQREPTTRYRPHEYEFKPSEQITE